MKRSVDSFERKVWTVWGAGVVLALAFWIAVIAVALHFILKFW